jgi:membrane fusion protein (multidrug efflux system)
VAEVRARVSGIVLARKFTEGSDVKAGDVLFQIDPAMFQASVDSASAQLQRAQASLSLAVQQAERQANLQRTNATSRDQYDVAMAAQKQAEADVALAKANLQTAQLNLGYATVRSPIDGRIGAALVTEGAFVRAEDGTQMATVRDLSSVYIDFTAPLDDVSKVAGDGTPDALGQTDIDGAVELVGTNGKVVGQPGRLLFSSADVNETTGQVSLRSEFRNPGNALLPGTYVRVRMTQGIAKAALLVPDRAVQWDTLGQAKVTAVVDGKAMPQPIVTGRSFSNRWIVASGLKPGDQIVVDGAEKAMPGSPVNAQSAPESGSAQTQQSCTTSCADQAKM